MHKFRNIVGARVGKFLESALQPIYEPLDVTSAHS